MNADALEALPPRPESEFEWEDLLVRLELMPRALKIAVENAGSCPEALAADLVCREVLVQRQLEVAAGGRREEVPGVAGGAPLSDPQVKMEAEDAVDHFVRLRNRNFAMLQRRGIDVWDWEVEVEPLFRATVFQLLSMLVLRDVEALARLRNGRSLHIGAC